MHASLVFEVLGLESICKGFGGYVLIGSTMVLAILALYIAWYFFQAKRRFPAWNSGKNELHQYFEEKG